MIDDCERVWHDSTTPQGCRPPNKVETLKLLTEKDAETLLGADFGAFLEVQKR